MFIKRTLTVLFIIILSESALANVEALTEQETQQSIRLNDMVWLERLSEDQIADVKAALLSTKDILVQQAIRVVAVHRLQELAPDLSRVSLLNKRPYNKAFAELVGQELSSEAAKYLALRSCLSGSLSGDELRDVDSDMKPFMYVRGMISSILAINEVRSLRQGLISEPNTVELDLTDYQKMLLEYGKMTKDKAISNIVGTLKQAEILSSREYDLMRVLQSYGTDAVKAVITKLSNPETRATMSGYGKTILLKFVQSRLAIVADYDLKRLQAVLPIMKNDEFGPLTRTVAVIELQIQQLKGAEKK